MKRIPISAAHDSSLTQNLSPEQYSVAFSSAAGALSHQSETPLVLLLKICWQLHCIQNNFSKYHSVEDML